MNTVEEESAGLRFTVYGIPLIHNLSVNRKL